MYIYVCRISTWIKTTSAIRGGKLCFSIIVLHFLCFFFFSLHLNVRFWCGRFNNGMMRCWMTCWDSFRKSQCIHPYTTEYYDCTEYLHVGIINWRGWMEHGVNKGGPHFYYILLTHMYIRTHPSVSDHGVVCTVCMYSVNAKRRGMDVVAIEPPV